MMSASLEELIRLELTFIRRDRIYIERLTYDSGGLLIFKCPTCKITRIECSEFVEKGLGYLIMSECVECFMKKSFASGGIVNKDSDLVGERCCE